LPKQDCTTVKRGYTGRMSTARLAPRWATAVVSPQLIGPERWQLGTIDRFTKAFNTEAVIEHI
jgi:hypothetical protein